MLCRPLPSTKDGQPSPAPDSHALWPHICAASFHLWRRPAEQQATVLFTLPSQLCCPLRLPACAWVCLIDHPVFTQLVWAVPFMHIHPQWSNEIPCMSPYGGKILAANLQNSPEAHKRLGKLLSVAAEQGHPDNLALRPPPQQDKGSCCKISASGTACFPTTQAAQPASKHLQSS